MKTPNKYVTIVFGLAVLFATYELVISPAMKRPTSKPNKAIESPPAELLPAEPLPALIEPLTVNSVIKPRDGASVRQKRGKTLEWGRDPFLFPKGIEPYKKVEEEKEEMLLSLKVHAILISGRQKVATINRAPYVVSINDWIENEQVLKIKPDRVVLGKNGKSRELLLEPLKFAPVKIQRIE